MASFSKVSNVILSSDLATQGIRETLTATNTFGRKWFSGNQDTLVGLFKLIQRVPAALDELTMARLFALSLEKAWYEGCVATPNYGTFDDEAKAFFAMFTEYKQRIDDINDGHFRFFEE